MATPSAGGVLLIPSLNNTNTHNKIRSGSMKSDRVYTSKGTFFSFLWMMTDREDFGEHHLLHHMCVEMFCDELEDLMVGG